MMNLKEKDNKWIDDIIKQHKKQLEDIKKNRNTIGEIEEKSMFQNREMLKSVTNHNIYNIDYNDDNLYRNKLERKGNEYMNNDIAVTNRFPNLNLDYNNNTIEDEYNKCKSSQIIEKNNKSSNSSPISQMDIHLLKSKLETKKFRIREMKKQIKNILEENSNLKQKLDNLEKYKSSIGEKVDNIEKENKSHEIKFLGREKELFNTIAQLEQEKLKAEEKLSKVLSLDNIKSQEIELMNQKIKDFELILDENQNEHIESLKNMKMELEGYKQKHYEYDKFFDILNYFFKKMKTSYGCDTFINNNLQSNSSNSNWKNTENKDMVNETINDPKMLQNKLLELENYIKLINEKIAMNKKYQKYQQSQIESLDNSQYNIEKTHKLNDKIINLTEENKVLKEQLNDMAYKRKSKVHYYKEIPGTNVSRIDKDNIFANNFRKEQTKQNTSKNKRNKSVGENFKKNRIKTVVNKNNSKATLNNYKTLEQRVMELERELKQREKSYSKDSLNYYSENPKDTIEGSGSIQKRTLNSNMVFTTQSNNQENIFMANSHKNNKKKKKLLQNEHMQDNLQRNTGLNRNISSSNTPIRTNYSYQ